MPYQVRTQKFEGPIELLLRLIEERKFSINDVSLAEVSVAYLEHVKGLGDIPRRDVASFLVIASTLMLIKSKSLLPSLELSPEERESMDDLERRLKLYQHLRGLAEHIQSRYGANVLYRREAFLGVSARFVEPKKMTVGVLYSALKNLIASMPIQPVLPEKIIEIILKIEDKMTELALRVRTAVSTSFKTFAGSDNKRSLIVSFLAMLELVKQGLITARQERTFDDIDISSAV